VTLEGFQPSGRFGSALAVLDFNKDGMPDLAVGAPSVGSEKLAYTGAVYVYFGSRQGGVSSGPNVTISCQVQGPPGPGPDLAASCCPPLSGTCSPGSPTGHLL